MSEQVVVNKFQKVIGNHNERNISILQWAYAVLKIKTKFYPVHSK
jgi:hypothetical protein